MRQLRFHEFVSVSGGMSVAFNIEAAHVPEAYVVYESVVVYDLYEPQSPFEMIEIEYAPSLYYGAPMSPIYGPYMCGPYFCNVHLGPAFW